MNKREQDSCSGYYELFVLKQTMTSIANFQMYNRHQELEVTRRRKK